MPRDFESDEPSFNLVLHFAKHFDRHLQKERAFHCVASSYFQICERRSSSSFFLAIHCWRNSLCRVRISTGRSLFRHTKSVGRPLKLINRTKEGFAAQRKASISTHLAPHLLI